MLRRLSASTTCNARIGNVPAKSSPITQSRRHLEPMSVWYLASWTCVWWYGFYFMMPAMFTDLMIPSMMYNKLPVIHFVQERRAEQKLRRILDETYTEWNTELDMAHTTEAVSRTF